MAGVYTDVVSSIAQVGSLQAPFAAIPLHFFFSPSCSAVHEIGGGRLTERASSCVGGSRGLDRVERRLRAEAANIPLSNMVLEEDWGYKEEEEARKDKLSELVRRKS